MTFNPFWLNVLTALRSLWKSSIMFDKSVIMETPIRYNPSFCLQIRKEWKDKGIMVVSDFTDYLTVPLSFEEFNQKYQITMNF